MISKSDDSDSHGFSIGVGIGDVQPFIVCIVGIKYNTHESFFRLVAYLSYGVNWIFLENIVLYDSDASCSFCDEYSVCIGKRHSSRDLESVCYFDNVVLDILCCGYCADLCAEFSGSWFHIGKYTVCDYSYNHYWNESEEFFHWSRKNVKVYNCIKQTPVCGSDVFRECNK